MTTFKKPQNVTLTQMAQWVDKHEVITEEDKNLQVEYLYHLVLYRARQCALFRDNNIYDDFALYGVTKLLTRLNNKQELPVKSIANYIRTVIRHWYAEYVRLFCCGDPNLPQYDFDVNDFGDYLIDLSSETDYKMLVYFSSDITAAMKQHLCKIPHKRNSAEWMNICISCFLTLEDRVSSATTLINSALKNKTIATSRAFRRLRTAPPILFHLDDSYAAYISVLVNELIHVMSAELTSTLRSEVSVSDCLKNLVIAAQNNEEP